MQSATNIQDLATQIAESIARGFAAEKEAGRITNNGGVLSLAGFITEGDHSSRIDFGNFHISNLVQGQGPRHDVDPANAPPSTSNIESVQFEESLDSETTSPRQMRTRNRRRHHAHDSSPSSSSSETTKRRKLTGGLRLAPSTQRNSPRESEKPEPAPGRQLQATARLPQRKPVSRDEHALKPSTLSKLLVGIWDQIFSSIRFDMSAVVDEWHEAQVDQGLTIDGGNGADGEASTGLVARPPNRAFSQMNVLCRKISQASRVSRALEVIVQARWIEHFDDRIQAILRERGDISQTKARMAALAEACRDFGWTEKELRNKMAIWRGYKEIKDAGGWVCLVFAGMGIYRFCKYRISFDAEAMQSLRRHKSRFEVAADTLHPHWREMLSIVDAASPRLYTGHPHDWVVSDFAPPVSLAQTYAQWDPDFAFTHLDASILDVDSWGSSDPRLVAPPPPEHHHHHDAATATRIHICSACAEPQSEDATINACRCFPSLQKTTPSTPYAVQVFRTKTGKNNGLIACSPFERGTAVGEFIGLITRGLEGVDAMQADAADGLRYQIWQGRQGNHTRFVNHSCRPNSQFQRFVWMGMQRVVLVSRGIEAGQEITVDYSDAYWRNLGKVCRCGEPCCRFKDGGRVKSVSS